MRQGESVSLILKDPSRHGGGGVFDVSDVALSEAGDDVTGAARAYLRRAPPANMKADGADCAATNRQSNPLLLNADFKNAL